MIKIYKGNILYTETSEKFTIVKNGYISVEDGIIERVYSELPEKI